MNPETLQTCQLLLEYEFKNPKLLELALTHASVAPTREKSNERMEFLGDAVLGLVICDELYRRYDVTEGVMTRIKSTVVSRQTCAEIADACGLGKIMALGKGMDGPNGLPMSVSAAVFEAVIGAIYLDGGLKPAGRFILKQMQSYIENAFDSVHQYNYKSMLQQHLQQIRKCSPEYHLLDEKGPDHAKCFEIAVAIEGKFFPSAWGKNKKDAEQAAAKNALQQLDLLDE